MSNNWPWVYAVLPCILDSLARPDRIPLFLLNTISSVCCDLCFNSCVSWVYFVAQLLLVLPFSDRGVIQLGMLCISLRQNYQCQLAVVHIEPGYCTKNLLSLFGYVQSTKIESKVIKWCLRRGEERKRKGRKGEEKTGHDNDSHEIAATFAKRWEPTPQGRIGDGDRVDVWDNVCVLLSTCAGIQISQCSSWYFSLQCITIVLGLDVKQHPDHIMRFSPNVTDWNCCHDAFAEGKNQKTKVQQFPALLVCLFGDREGGDIPPTRALSGMLPKVKCCSSQ